jgi:cell division protein FtsN
MDFGRWRQFGAGLAAGLVIALVVYVSDHRSSPPAADETPTPRKTAPPVQDPTITDGATGNGNFDFYEMLPKFEVVLPEKEHGARVDPAAKVDRPGTYFLQAGSYRKFEDADRVRAQLSKQGIEASVQRVAVDTDVWHRVRIGPMKDLNQLNRLRQQLQATDIDSLVIRVED